MTRTLYVLLILGLLAGGVYTSRTQWAPLFVGAPTVTAEPADRAGLPGRDVPMIPSPHIRYLGEPHATYTSVPPTSGPHLPWTAAPGIYTSPVPDELTVHALEHGHVAILYASDTSADQVRALEDLARQRPRDVVLAPYPALKHGIALTAWARIENLDTEDNTAILSFVDALAGRYNHGWVSKLSQSVAMADCSSCGCGCC